MNILLATLLLISAVPSVAQLAAPNSSGVSMGLVRVIAPDPEPVEKALVAMGGSAPHKMNTIDFINLGGVFMVVGKGDSNGGTVGSVLNHIGFQVKSIATETPKWQSAGIKVEMGTIPIQRWLTLPGDIRVEILEEPKLETPIKFHHVHFFLPAVAEAQAWYAKMFGAAPAKRNPAFEDDDIPGAIIRFTKVDAALLPTKGRTVNHVGFEIANLDEFAKKLESQGIKFDVAVRKVPDQDLKVGFITDPWGTYIELAQGLEKVAK